jgi:hypothetical protein
MSTYGLIYLIGSIIVFIVTLFLLIKNEKVITILDLFGLFSISFIFSLFSWLGVFIAFLVIFGDVVLFERK